MPDVCPKVRPLLKWAGGKRQLLPELRPFYPPGFNRYFEPFLGSGAVFLDLHNSGLLDGRAVYLSDINADIIGCYRAVRDDVDAVIAALQAHDRGYRAAGGAHFYKVRDRDFNPARLEIHASDDPAAAYTPALAAMLIFLNRTGFNGLFRLNARGGFNVPHGRNANPRICDEDNLRAWSRLLRRPEVHLDVCGFDVTLDRPRREISIISRPPTPQSAARRGSPPPRRASTRPQTRLQRAVLRLTARGASILLSNSAAPQIRALARAIGAPRLRLQTNTVAARRRSTRGRPAGSRQENVLITNVKP